MSTPSVTPIGQDQKYCSECGKIILRRAEICPGCGCRQLFSSNNQMGQVVRTNTQPQLESPFVGKMILLIVLNVPWPGLGNLAVGDPRGWKFLLICIPICLLGFFTAWVPVILFFAYCCYEGYQFLLKAAAPSSPMN